MDVSISKQQHRLFEVGFHLKNFSQPQDFLYACVYVVCQPRSQVQLCIALDGSPPGSSVHGILQARIRGWVAISISSGSSWSRDQTHVCCIVGRCFTIWAMKEALCTELWSKQESIFPRWYQDREWELTEASCIQCSWELRGSLTLTLRVSDAKTVNIRGYLQSALQVSLSGFTDLPKTGYKTGWQEHTYLMPTGYF